MACKTETTEIAGKKVSVTQWPASKAIEMQVLLLSIMQGYAIDMFEAESNVHVNQILQMAMANSKPDEFIGMVRKFVMAAAVEGKTLSESSFDIEYSGDLPRLFETFVFVAKTNFSGFFAIGLNK